MFEFLKPHFSEILLALGGIAAWIFERSKRKEDLKTAKTQNLQSVLDFYQDAIKDLRNNYDATINDMKRTNDVRFGELELDVKKLRDNVNLWKGKYAALKREFDIYKQKHEK